MNELEETKKGFLDMLSITDEYCHDMIDLIAKTKERVGKVDNEEDLEVEIALFQVKSTKESENTSKRIDEV